MRIRRHVRRASAEPGFETSSQQTSVFSVWRLGWDRDCENNYLLQHQPALTAAAAAAAAAEALPAQEEESWVDFLTMSVQGPHSDAGFQELYQSLKPESVSENSSGVVGVDLIKPVDDSYINNNAILSSPDAHVAVTRHYVRRIRRDHGADLQCEPTHGKAMCHIVKPSCGEEVGADQIQESLRTDLSRAANDSTCTISKGDSMVHHPSGEAEGSLLHALYLQLLAAGKEGLTVRELFASFKTQMSVPSLGVDWKERVRAHLKSNPYFGEVKGRYLLREQVVVLNDLPMAAGFDRGARCKPRSDHVQPFELPTAGLHFSCDSHDIHEAILTSRKSNNSVIEEALGESAMEPEKIQKLQDGAATKVVLTLTDFRPFNYDTPVTAIVQSTTRVPSLESSRRKRKSLLRRSDVDIFQSIKNGRATPGALIALQAKIVAESGVQTGTRCSRKDDRRNWRCPLMAKEGHSLCEHHIFLKERKKARHAEDVRINKSEKLGKSLQEFIMPDLTASPVDEDDHVVEALVTLKSSHVPRDAACQYLTQAIAHGHRLVDHLSVMKDRTSEKLLQHLFTSAPKRRHIAAKKTAVNGPVPLKDYIIEPPPAIPPLPMQFGFRRKTVKNKSLLSF